MNSLLRINFSFREWTSWLKSLSFDLKVFMLFTLFTPIINLLWNISAPGVGVSFTSIINGIFIIYFLLYLFLNPIKKPSSKLTYIFLNFFCLLFLFKSLYIIFFFFEMAHVEQALRNLYFYIFYFMLIRLIQSEFDMLMIIRTYIYSQYFIIINFLVGFSSVSRESRGFDRYTLGYYDSTNVALQSVFIIALIIFLFIYFKKLKVSFSNKINFELLFVFLVTLYIVKGTYHILSYLNVGVILGLFFITSIKNIFSIILPLIVVVPVILSSLDIFSTFYDVIARDLSFVFSGNIPTYLLHGRVKIWSDYIEKYYTLNSFEIFTGYYWSPHASTYAHNDFLRIFATIGSLGFVVYILFLFAFSVEIWSTKARPLRWAGVTLFAITLLYSLTIAPTAYSFVCLPLLTIIIYILKYNDNKLVQSH